MTPQAQDALRRVLGIGVTGLGVGAGARSLLALRQLFTTPPSVAPTSSVPSSLELPVPPRLLQREKEKRAWDEASEALEKAAHEYWQIPASVGLGAAGLAGGWGMIDSLMNKFRERQSIRDVEDARSEYEAALKDQYASAMMAKGAAAEPYEGLNEAAELFVEMDKESGARDALNAALGTYLTAMGGTGLGMGYLAYKWGKRNSGQEMVDAALRRRAQQRQAPQPIYVYPKADPALDAEKEAPLKGM